MMFEKKSLLVLALMYSLLNSCLMLHEVHQEFLIKHSASVMEQFATEGLANRSDASAMYNNNNTAVTGAHQLRLPPKEGNVVWTWSKISRGIFPLHDTFSQLP